MQKALNLGCGNDIRETTSQIEYINVDKVKLKGVNMTHDLNIIPYPFESESINLIVLKDILEHLDNPIDVLQECYRLLKKGGECLISVVYWNHKYSYSDPQHKWAFSERYFDFFTIKSIMRPYYMKYHFLKLEIKYLFDKKAIEKYGEQENILLKKAYHHCNIIQGMEVTLTK